MLLGGLTTGVVFAPAPVASAQQAPLRAQTTAESWFRTLPATVPSDPVCPPVGGCLPAVPEVAPPSPYSAGTLHVGYSGAAEDSRTYLELNLSAIPFGAELSGGTLTLPVATDPQAGTLLPETAALQACLVATSVPDAIDGGINGAQPADCETSSPGTFVPAKDGQPAAFTVDLKPFADAWAIGTAALALVPAAEQAEGASWHVAFSRRDRVAEGAAPITAQLLLTEADSGSGLPPGSGSGSGSGLPPVEEPSRGFDAGSLALDAGTSFAAPPVPAGITSPVTAPEQAPQTAPLPVSPVATVLTGSYAYPGVFLLPVLLAAVAGWLGRVLTRDLVAAGR